ncbi:MAG: hypothetical protein ACI865_003268 [Flavobacteriaceae bacterium]|jgi:hypothetical protein
MKDVSLFLVLIALLASCGSELTSEDYEKELIEKYKAYKKNTN